MQNKKDNVPNEMVTSIIASMHEARSRLRSLSGCLIGNNSIVAIGEGNLAVYMDLATENNVVTGVTAVINPLRASWLTPEDAASVARTCSNGHGDKARVVKVRRAIRDYLTQQKKALHLFTRLSVEGTL